MRLKPGDALYFDPLPDEQAEVADEHHLRPQGETVSLTALRDRLGEKFGTGRYSGSISVNGRMFDDLYLDMSGPAAPGTVATMNPPAVHRYWLAGDRDGYVDYCMTYGKTDVGIKPTKP